MADSEEERLARVREVATAVSDLEPAVQQAAIQAVIPPPTGEAVNKLWMTLVQGLLLLLVIALLGLLYLLIDDKSSDVALTVFTSLLTGLIGLFAPSPTSTAGGGGR
jgi:hypothetical protein